MIHGIKEPARFPCSSCRHRVPEDTLTRTAPGKYLCEECVEQRESDARDALILQTSALLIQALQIGPVRKALPPVTIYVDTGSAFTAIGARDLLTYGCWKATARGTWVGVTHTDAAAADRAILAALETLGKKPVSTIGGAA